jgi:4-diphosphocytidyl-2-C-methyl-D-erythritol kinase
MMMISFPRAKINIGLRIVRKRTDGFHDIETIFYPVPLCDALEFVRHPENVKDDELTVTGIDIRTKQEKNLVITAVRKLRNKHPLPFLKIHLHKAIPAGAGLGGGSSDAACMLKAADRCFSLSLSEPVLRAIALELGSDCPFFIDPVPSVGTGRGEKLKPLKPFLEGYHLVLINPRIHISTRDAYINSRPSVHEQKLEEFVTLNPAEWKRNLSNDFEDYAFRLYPQMNEMKRSLYGSGALYASMSGSGSAIYGIFESRPEISRKLKDYVIWEGLL